MNVGISRVLHFCGSESLAAGGGAVEAEGAVELGRLAQIVGGGGGDRCG